MRLYAARVHRVVIIHRAMLSRLQSLIDEQTRLTETLSRDEADNDREGGYAGDMELP